MTPIDQLRATAEKLPPELREQILALRAEAVPPLIAILNDEQLGMSESPAEGWPPIHAVELLADRKATEAIEPMLDVLVETTFDDVISSNLLGRLPEFGAAVLEPTLLRLKDARDEDVAHALVAVLAKLGIKDERILDAICDVFDEDLVFGTMVKGGRREPGRPERGAGVRQARSGRERRFSRSDGCAVREQPRGQPERDAAARCFELGRGRVEGRPHPHGPPRRLRDGLRLHVAPADRSPGRRARARGRRRRQHCPRSRER